MTFRPVARSLVILLALTGFSALSIYLIQPPQAQAVNAPLTEFSAGRAMQHVRQIAREPHAMGTAAHARVRTYLAAQLRQLGLQTIVQDTTVVQTKDGRTTAGHVYNILGRRKGRTRGKAVLLMAHYDSQPNTPGAGDDGAGIAALLETVRALRNTPLRNDVILLMTDGEEYGLFGATAFLRHPWASDVGFVINLEARGNSGPSMTFEISPDNGWVVEGFAKAAPRPLASSLMYEVYRVLPNYTDFTVFRNRGYAGVNSAFTDGFIHYHKLTDTPDRLNQNSLQHHGSNLLALTRYFGNTPLDQTKAADKVFFNPAGTWLVQYPLSFSWVLVGLLTVVLVVTTGLGLKKRTLTIGQSVGGFFLFLVILLLIIGAILGVNLLVSHFLPYAHFYNGVYGSDAFSIGYGLLTIGLFLLLTRLALRWVRPFSLAMGVYWLLYLLTVLLAVRVPSASYLFLFPLLFCLLGTVFLFWRGLYQRATRLPYALISLLSLLPTLAMLVPLVWLLFVIFSLQLPMAAMAMLTLVLGLLLPLLLVVEQTLRWRSAPLLSLLLLVAGTLQTIWAVRNETPTAERPLHSQVSYYLDADTQRAYWASSFQQTDDWNRQFFSRPTVAPLTELYPIDKTAYLKNSAEALPIAGPAAQVISDSEVNGERQLSIRLRSLRQAAHLEIILQTQSGSDLLQTRLNGEPFVAQPIQTDGGTLFYTPFYGLPLSKEVTLTVRLKAHRSLRLLLYDQSIGLPASLVKTPPPAHVIPEQGRKSNLTVVRKTYQF